MNISEVTQEQVDALKANDKAFCRMGDELIRAAGIVGGTRDYRVLDRAGKWVVLDETCEFLCFLTYRLRSDYELPAKKEEEYYYLSIFPDGDLYKVDLRRNDVLCDIYNLTAFVSFAGVQFEGQSDPSLWFFDVRIFIDPDGVLRSNGCAGRSPAVPIRARFIKGE